MKTAREFIERMRADGAFVDQMREKFKAATEAGEKDVCAAASKAAKELGYDVSPEQVREITQQNEEITPEELGKIAGGTSCTTAALSGTIISTMLSGLSIWSAVSEK